MLILGEMRELGADSAQEHRQVIRLIQEYGFKDVILVGQEFMYEGNPFRCFADVEALNRELLPYAALDMVRSFYLHPNYNPAFMDFCRARIDGYFSAI